MNRFFRTTYVVVDDDGIRRVYALVRDAYGAPIGLEYFGPPDEDRGLWRHNAAPEGDLPGVATEQLHAWARDARAAAGVNNPYPMLARFRPSAA